MTASHPTATVKPPLWAPALAGTAAAGVALGLGELFAGFSNAVPSFVVAVGEAIIDYTPGDLIETGINAAGRNDKPALLTGIVVVSLLIGAWLGVRALHHRRSGDIGFLVFGVIGAWAAARNPFASAGWSWVAALAAALAGGATLRFLLTLATLPESSLPHREVADAHFPSRRAFLTLSAGAAVAALGTSAIGRALRDSRGIGGVRENIALPAAKLDSSAIVPTSGVLDDAVPGISTYITPNKSFYRIDTALVVPQVDPKSWKLKVGGLVNNPYTVTYDDVLAMDLVEQPITMACVSNEVGDKLVGNATWLGVPLTKLLDRAGVKPEGTQVVGISVDDFDASFPTQLAYDGRIAMLAVGMNGEPLPVIHGFPARLVVAGLYGYVSAVKWIREIRLATNDYDAYWIPRGWSKLGPIKTQSRIDVPRDRARVVAGHTPIAGVAWAPTKGIAKVEVQVDGGEWQPCRLGEGASNNTWVQWVIEWEATPGSHTVAVRATDQTGFTQSPNRVDPRPNGAEGYHTIRVSVT